jgi:trk system potassium uptake protein
MKDGSMKIVLLGAGQVGATLAESLTKEGHDVAVVDVDEPKLIGLQQRLDIQTVCGKASYPAIQRAAGMEDADLMVAVTDNDEANMVSCQVAHSLFKTPMKIARIRSPHYFIRCQLFGDDDMPIDEFINPEQLVTQHIAKLIQYPGTIQVLDFADEKVKFVVVKPYYGGKFVGQSLQMFHQAYPLARIVAIYRGGESVPLRRSTHIEVGDEIFFIGCTQQIDSVMSAFRRMDKPFSDVMIVGGGNIGSRLAGMLEDDYHVKIIDHSNENCLQMVKQLKNTTVLCGDASDKALLVSENIEKFDAFCAVTNDDEANIMSSLQAKKLGARQVMALVNRTTYVDLIADGEINVVISPEQVTISRILAFIRRGDVARVHSLHRGEVEVIEAVAHEDGHGASVVGKAVKAITLPKGSVISAIVRGECVMIPDGKEVIASGDHVIVFVADKKHIPQIEKLFQSEVAMA